MPTFKEPTDGGLQWLTNSFSQLNRVEHFSPILHLTRNAICNILDKLLFGPDTWHRIPLTKMQGAATN